MNANTAASLSRSFQLPISTENIMTEEDRFLYLLLRDIRSVAFRSNNQNICRKVPEGMSTIAKREVSAKLAHLGYRVTITNTGTVGLPTIPPRADDRWTIFIEWGKE